MGKYFCKVACLSSCLIILGNKRWCPMASAWEGWNKVQDSIHISCLVASVLGSQDSAGRIPGKKAMLARLEARVPRRNILLPNPNFTPFCWPSEGMQFAGFIVGVSSTDSVQCLFPLWPKCWIAGELSVPMLAVLSCSLCREVTWHSSRAVTWPWRMEGAWVLLVDHFGLWLPSFLGNRGPFLLLWGSKC